MANLTTGHARPEAMAFVLLTVALSWSTWISAWLATGRPATTTASAEMIAAIYAGSFAPGIAAAILSAMSALGSLKEWLRGFVRFRCGWRTYAAALLPLPLALLLLTFVFGYAPRLEGLHGRPVILLYLTIFPVSIFNGLATAVMGAGPLGEEGGWRGYLPLYTIGVVGLSFIMSRVWLIGGGSLVPCIWLHGLVNAVGGVAFDQRLWTSRWSVEAATGHFAVATGLTAALLIAARRRRSVPKSGHIEVRDW